MRWIALLFLLPSISLGATRTFLGGNWNATGSWLEGAVPTGSDDVVSTAISGQLTITASAICGSLDFSTMLSSVTQAAATNLTVAGAGGNFTLRTGLVWGLGNVATSALIFQSPGTSTQTITMGGVISGNTTLGGAGFFVIASSINTGATAAVTFTSGTLHWDGATDNAGLQHTVGSMVSSNSNTRRLIMGTSTTTVAATGINTWGFNITTGLTFVQGTSNIIFSGAGPQININSNFTFNNVTFSALTGATSLGVTGSNTWTFRNLSAISGASKVGIFGIGVLITVTETLTFTGNSATNRLLVDSRNSGGSSIGTQRTFTVTGATVTGSNFDLRDINFSPAQNFASVTGASGDCGGNSNAVFSAAETQNATGTASFTWSTHGWTTRVPICQDDVFISNALISGRTITADMPRLGKTVNMSTATWAGTAPTFSNSVGQEVYGSLTFSTNGGTGSMLWTGNNGFSFQGRSTYTVTTGGLAVATTITLLAPGGVLVQQDAFTNSQPLTISLGVWRANNFNVTASVYTLTNNVGASADMGAGVWTVTSTGTAWNTAGASFVVAPGTSQIFFSNTSATSKTMAGNTKTYYDLRIASSAVGGSMTISGNNTFHNISIEAPKDFILTAGSTQTITGSFTTNSVAGTSVTVRSATAGTNATLSDAAGTQCLDYITLKDSFATGGATWYAGANSTSISGVSGWTIGSSCPAGNTGNFFLLFSKYRKGSLWRIKSTG